MDDNILGFDVNAEIIAVIKKHRANTATMAREIVILRSDLLKASSDYAALRAMYERDCASLRAEYAAKVEELEAVAAAGQRDAVLAISLYQENQKLKAALDGTHLAFVHASEELQQARGWIAGILRNESGQALSNIAHWRPLPEPPQEDNE